MGEIMFRGNITMKGYLKNPKATDEAFAGGWFHSGDLAVMQPDGYVKIKDRSQGHHHLGRREHQLARSRGHAVPASGGARGRRRRAARPEVGRDALRVRRVEAGRDDDGGRAHRALPRASRALQGAEEGVCSATLPKTSTGKIQKFMLRDKAKSASAIE